MIEEENFPLVTFILAALILFVFLFTTNETVTPLNKTMENGKCEITCPQTCKNYFGHKVCVETNYGSCSCIIPKLRLFENLFGFIPLKPKVYSLVSYSFIHVDVTHLLFNLVFLFVAGLAVEQTLGKFVFFSVYISSANIAVIFDILGRFISQVSFGSPFVGASGAIFGVLTIAALLRPDEKIPTFLNVLVLIGILMSFYPYLQLFYNYEAILGSQTFLLVIGVLIMVLASVLAFLPSFPSLYTVMLIFTINWMIVVTLNLSPGVSNVGHLGGMIGGIVSLFVFGKTKKT